MTDGDGEEIVFEGKQLDGEDVAVAACAPLRDREDDGHDLDI